MADVIDSDFYEDDECPEEIRAIFEAAEKGRTDAPRRGWNLTFPRFAPLGAASTYFGTGSNRTTPKAS